MEEQTLAQLKKFIDGKVRFPEKDRARVRAALLRRIEEESVRNAPVAPSSGLEPRNDPRRAPLRNQSKPFMFIGTIIAVMLSGGVAFAAEGALPGELLYPLKVHVLEEIRGFAAVGAEADARWEARRAERRLEEAELLKAGARLDAERRTEVVARFGEHAEDFAKERNEVEENGEASVSVELKADFETRLRAHADTILELGGTSGGSSSAATSAEGGVDAIIQAAVEGRSTATAAVDAKIPAILETAAGTDAEAGGNIQGSAQAQGGMDVSGGGTTEMKANSTIETEVGASAGVDAGGVNVGGGAAGGIDIGF